MGEGGQFPEGASPRGPRPAPAREPSQGRLGSLGCAVIAAATPERPPGAVSLCERSESTHGCVQADHGPLPGRRQGTRLPRSPSCTSRCTPGRNSSGEQPPPQPAALPGRVALSAIPCGEPGGRTRPRPNDPPTQSSVCCRPLHDTHCWVCKSDFLTVSFYLPIWQAFIYFYYEAKSLKL